MVLAAGLVGAGHADQKDPRLEPLFEQLKSAPGEAEAKPLEAQIWEIWGETARCGQPGAVFPWRRGHERRVTAEPRAPRSTCW